MINRFVKVTNNCQHIRSTWRAHYAPDRYCRHYWDFMMIFVITSVLLLVPYQAAFEMEKKSSIWNLSKNFLLLICCGDVVVNLRTGQVSRACACSEFRRDVTAGKLVRVPIRALTDNPTDFKRSRQKRNIL